MWCGGSWVAPRPARSSLSGCAARPSKPTLGQPYELLAERHLAMDVERYLQVRVQNGVLRVGTGGCFDR
jgi:hypothetical protein